MKTIRAYVTGTVQGVFFRRFIKEEADKLSIRGFVRNLEDGRVEILAEGKDENVNQFVDLCKKGPKHAEVKNLEVNEIKHQGFEEFKISSF